MTCEVVTISDNDMRLLLLYVQATSAMHSKGNDLHLCNRARLARMAAARLMTRKDIRRVMGKVAKK